ncbi:MAG: ATP-binding protein [Myxococcota bacterium]|nr:ATP-binding protein [Myxococcota bacterium]
MFPNPDEFQLYTVEIHFLLQIALLAYLLGMGSKSPLKKWLDRAIFVYCFYGLSSLAAGRNAYLAIQAGQTELGLQDFPPIWGLSQEMWVSLALTFLVGFLNICLHFWYTLLKRKRDAPMILIHVMSIIGFIWWTLFPEDAIGDWKSMGRTTTIFYFPGYVYGLVIMWRGLGKMQENSEKRQLRILFYAFLIPMFVGLVNILLIDLELLSNRDTDIIRLLIGMIRTILLVIAIRVYGIFRINLEHASQDIFDNMDDPVLLLSPKDEIIRANRSAQRCLDIPETPQKTEKIPPIQDLVPNYSGDDKRFETAINTKEGLREYNCSRTTVVRQDVTMGSILLFRDVTREKELARMKTEFTSTVSHELRTPLTSVLGFAKIIQKRFNDIVLPNYHPTERKEKRAVKQISQNLDVIVSESKRLTNLINDVLDISKMEAGRIEWRFTRCNPNGILEQALQATDGLFGTKPVVLIREIPENLPEIVADSDRIIQVIINLVSNAVKFTENGSVTVNVEIAKGNLIVHVTDTGTGIGEADQKLVFEKYKQVGDVITDKPQGTGLGLPISKQIVEQHGGRIWVESTLQKGTTFSFSLPLADLPQTLHQPISFQELLNQIDRLKYTPTEGSKKILLIDDEASIRQILRQSFEAAGHNVIEAEDGKMGLHTVYEQKPDLIILDVMMPKMNGFDVAATLKNDPEYMGIPIIMLTVVDDAQRIYGLGVERYITKPFEPQKIVMEATDLIKNRGSASKAILLGDLGKKVSVLRNKLSENGYTLHVASDLETLSRLIGQHEPHFLVVCDTQFQEGSGLASFQNTLGTTAILTRTILPD